MPQKNDGDGDGFGMMDQPDMSASIRALLNVPGLDIDPELLKTLPPAVLKTLVMNLANTGYVEQNKPVRKVEPVPVPPPIEVCPETDKDGIPHYCRNMMDDMYHDPWNPWCGYIECVGGMAKRKVCKQGSWMDNKFTLGKTQKQLCQMPFSRSGAIPCSMFTEQDLCRNAAKVASPEVNDVHEYSQDAPQEQK